MTRTLRSIVRVPGVAIVLVVLCATFGIASPGFSTPANIANILTQCGHVGPHGAHML